MPRNDYISDNLVNIRERLKQNYANPGDSAAPETPGTAPAGPGGRGGRGDELERTRRDLEGRLQRDLAAVNAELEQEIERRRELEKFLAVLSRVSSEVEALQGDADKSGEYARRLERLRLEYFQAAGRVSAFERYQATGTAAEGADCPKNFGRLLFEALPLIFGILAGAAIVAAALLVSFL